LSRQIFIVRIRQEESVANYFIDKSIKLTYEQMIIC